MHRVWILEGVEYFYPRPPRGGRHFDGTICTNAYPFLSTPSARRATSGNTVTVASGWPISIHALREEGDLERRA